MAEEAPLDFRSFAMVVPMGLGMGAMLAMFGLYNRAPMMYVMGGAMAGGMLLMGVMQIGRGGRRNASARCAASGATSCATSGSCASRPATRPTSSAGTCCGTTRSRAGCGRSRWAAGCGSAGPATTTSAGSASASAAQSRDAGVHPAADQADRGPRTAVVDLAAPLLRGVPTVSGHADRASACRSFTSVEFDGRDRPGHRPGPRHGRRSWPPSTPRTSCGSPCSPTRCTGPPWEWVKWLPHNAHPTA